MNWTSYSILINITILDKIVIISSRWLRYNYINEALDFLYDFLFSINFIRRCNNKFRSPKTFQLFQTIYI